MILCQALVNETDELGSPVHMGIDTCTCCIYICMCVYTSWIDTCTCILYITCTCVYSENHYFVYFPEKTYEAHGVCVCIYLYKAYTIYMYRHVYTCIYMYIHVYTCIYMYIHV